jgi:hypothetical protein
MEFDPLLREGGRLAYGKVLVCGGGGGGGMDFIKFILMLLSMLQQGTVIVAPKRHNRGIVRNITSLCECSQAS